MSDHPDQVRNVAKAVAALSALPIVGPASAVLHRPIYDCASDTFELPCDFLQRNSSEDIHNIGRFNSQEVIEETVSGYAANLCTWRGVVLPMPDHIVFVWVDGGDSLEEPGARAWRLTRIDAEEWFGFYWRTGMRRSAAEIDPPFLVTDLRRDPSLWLARAAKITQACSRNPHFLRAADSCTHRPV